MTNSQQGYGHDQHSAHSFILPLGRPHLYCLEYTLLCCLVYKCTFVLQLLADTRCTPTPNIQYVLHPPTPIINTAPPSIIDNYANHPFEAKYTICLGAYNRGRNQPSSLSMRPQI